CMTGEAEPCRSICQGVGWPSPAHAATALASKIPNISAVALNRDNTGIDLPRSWPVLAVPAPRSHDICVPNTCLSCNGTFIVQRYGLMPPAAGGHRECCLGKASSGCGGSGSGRSALKAVAVGFPNVTRFERFSFQCSRRQEHRRSHAGAVAASAGVQHSAAKSREHLAGNGGPASL